MKDALLLTCAAVLAAGASVATTLFLSPAAAKDAGEGSDDGAAAPRADALASQLAALESKQEELDRFLATLETVTPAEAGTDPTAAIAEAVEAWLADNADALVAPGAVASEAGTEDPALAAIRNAEVSELIDLITDDTLSGEELQAAWSRIAETGRLDEVVSALEGMVEQDPQNPDLRVTLGNAYLQQLFSGESGPQAGILATKADEAFDAALRMDENHWAARFTKAVSLSNWPAFLGKQGEAIAEFERLVEIQEQQTADSNHAQTYLFLGNMYLETGDAAKALSTWRRGLERFPASDALREQIERNGGGS